LKDLFGADFDDSNVGVGDKRDGFKIYARTNVGAGYLTDEFVLSCSNG